MDKIGRYRIIGLLGKGGMGVVYKALDPEIEREVAIKTVRFDAFSDGTQKDDLMGRFIREARAAGKISHPNIVTVYDVGRENDLTYIVMQYIEGQSLQNMIDAGKQFSAQEIADLMVPLCACLDHAHENGIIHRDIKPANILIDKSGRPYLADFGVARIETSTVTQVGTTVGTLSYMSPEQIAGQTVDGRSDIFSLGVVFYELLSGKKPFPGDNISTIVYKIVHEQPRRVTEVNTDLPESYEAIVAKALAKDPAKRYQTCRELAVAIENAGTTPELFPARRADEPAAPVPGRKKSKALILGLAFLGVAALAGGVYFATRPKSGMRAASPQRSLALNKEDISPPTRSAAPAVANPAAPADEGVAKLREALERKNYAGAVSLAKEILAKEPANETARNYLNRAERETLSARIAPLLESGIAGFKSGNVSGCVQDMEKVLELDGQNREAQKYLALADTALARADISALIERHRLAEETKDLLAALADIDSRALAGQLEAEDKLLFNGYDEIRSSISGVTIELAGRTQATASFSHLLTAVYKKDGKRKVVFEGKKTWRLTKRGGAWVLTGTG